MPAQRRLVALLLALAAVVAPMVAALVVPDPTWIGGLYDGGDGDEAATLVWDHSSAVVLVGVALLGLIAAFVAAAQPAPLLALVPRPAGRLTPEITSPIDDVEAAPGGVAPAPSLPEGSGRWRTARRHGTGTRVWCIACSGFPRERGAPGCSWS